MTTAEFYNQRLHCHLYRPNRHDEIKHTPNSVNASHRSGQNPLPFSLPLQNVNPMKIP